MYPHSSKELNCLMVVISLSLTKFSTVECQFHPGPVSSACLQCICLAESKCQPLGCHMDESSLACGYFQIHKVYWLDCGRPGVSWKKCSKDKMCSSKCVQKYMERYATNNCPATCEGYAREHNGGPRGCHNHGTKWYWKLVKRQKGCQYI